MLNTIGTIGALMLAVCALPQTMLSLYNGNSNGLSHSFLALWFIGDLCMLYYVVQTIGTTGPLFYNYAANAVFLSIITYYKYFPRRK